MATADGKAVPAAGVFTANKMTAPPVLVSRAHLKQSSGHAAAVFLNSGNANAGTGEPGSQDAEELCAEVAQELGCAHDEVLIASTGLIGNRLPLESMVAAIPGLAAARSADGAGDAAQAILTTDTVRKEVVIDGGGFTVGGMAKGAAMLQPNMATMLAVLTTDAQAEPAVLQQVLRDAVTDTFNCITVDGATSTNDTVLLLASGVAGPVDAHALEVAVTKACASLAEQMVADAEGATKLVRIHVTGARSDAEARTAARAVATSQLTKCSWYGEDPYWGRVASDLGFGRRRLRPGPADDRLRRHRRLPSRGRGRARHRRRHRAHGRPGHRDDRRPGHLRGSGHGPDLRPDPRLRRREHGHVVSAPTTGADKAAVLVEALPYIRRFWGTTVVVKYGGNAMTDPALAEQFAQDIVLMHSVGLHTVVVHGGGPQIGELMARLGKESEFRDGLRVTDAETLDIARMVLVGKVGRDIVSSINVHAPLAVGSVGRGRRPHRRLGPRP